jgi:uncharacterized protein (DUF2345 family)
MADIESSSEPNTELQLAADHHLLVQREGERSLVRLRGPQGISLTIEVTTAGPILRFDGPSLVLDARGALDISAETIAIRARQGLELSAGGEARVAISGDLEVTAGAQTLRARVGSVEVHANDDVKLVGERIRLNC